MRILLITLLLSFPAYGDDLSSQDYEECLALGQIAGNVVVQANQGYTQSNIWTLYQAMGMDERMRPVIEELARLANHPELRELDTGDFMKLIVSGCLEERKNPQQDQ